MRPIVKSLCFNVQCKRMEPKPAPPEVAETDQAPLSQPSGDVNPADEQQAPPMPEITPAGLPNVNNQVEAPPAEPPQEPVKDEKQQKLEAAAHDLDKTPVPQKKSSSHAGLIIFTTVFIVSALSVLAIYAYLQSK